jgi:glycosyltransferase involved in cell wall biosynthesis
LLTKDLRTQRPRTEGKFLYIGDKKFFVKGVTYGAFAPNCQGHQFPELTEVARDFSLMRSAGINTILTYTVPPVSMLDVAQDYGLRVFINIPWMGHVCFLEDAQGKREIKREVKHAVSSCQCHPAVLMYAVAKELPPQIIRWYGKKKTEAFLKDLYHIAKDEDPSSLVTYTNFPTTEYLEFPFVDVFTYNVYLHNRPEFCSYLSRLQHLAGELPLVLTEIGMSSFHHGQKKQATFLEWQMEEAFDHGLAGTIVFSWTDPFYQDGALIEEWGFGLVDAERRPKPSYHAVQKRFTSNVPFLVDRLWPKVSVVVALHNAARTLDECLMSLSKLNYQNYEVIVVNDGSTDESADIIERYPFRTITTTNQGISASRNQGMKAATGEIVAYIDSDAMADPDWLGFLVATFQESDFAGVGGPNLVPKTDEWIAKCVYRSPGGPTQVMMDDTIAEHIPGCNMAFRKSALEDIGGFDPIFKTAADDVDICWRLLERKYTIGFSPSAVVLHRRRPSAKAYWKQQVGYGVSEALLERKHPNKFNPWGHTYWAGTIYAPYPKFGLFGKPVIYHGLWGSAGFQSMYNAGGKGVLNFLPRAMEWHVSLLALAVISVFFPWTLIFVGLGLGYTVFYCAHCACSANISSLMSREHSVSRIQRFKWRAMIGWLHFLEPLARDWGRLKGGLTPWRSSFHRTKEVSRRSSSRWWQKLQPFKRSVEWPFPGDMIPEKNIILNSLTKALNADSCSVGWNADYQDWDLKIGRGAFGEASLRMVLEYHGGPKRIARFSAVIRPSKLIYWFQLITFALAGLAGIMGFSFAFIMDLLLFAMLWLAPIREANRLEAMLQTKTDEVISSLIKKTNRETV